MRWKMLLPSPFDKARDVRNDEKAFLFVVQCRVIKFMAEAIYHLGNLTQSGTKTDESLDGRLKNQ